MLGNLFPGNLAWERTLENLQNLFVATLLANLFMEPLLGNLLLKTLLGNLACEPSLVPIHYTHYMPYSTYIT